MHNGTLLNGLAWLGTILNVVGALAVAHNKRIAGYYLFVIGDIFVVPIQVYTQTWAQVALIGVFASVNVYGYIVTKLKGCTS